MCLGQYLASLPTGIGHVAGPLNYGPQKVGLTQGRIFASKRPQPPADLISSFITGLEIPGQLRMYRYKRSSILDDQFIFVQTQWCTDLVESFSYKILRLPTISKFYENPIL